MPEPSGHEPDGRTGSVPERRAGDEFDDDGIAADEAAAVVESDIAELQSERTELVDTLRRVQADFENYRKRVLREQTALVDRATDRLVEGLLPVLDSFEGALGSITPDTPEMEKLLSGVSSIHAQLMSVLEKAGLEPIAADGAVFDPNEHEAVLHDEGNAEPRVGETMRTGYRLKGKVIRPAMVRVTRK